MAHHDAAPAPGNATDAGVPWGFRAPRASPEHRSRGRRMAIAEGRAVPEPSK